MFGYAKFKDRDELYALWRHCFDDSPEFTNWFFTERFLPHYCAVWVEGGRIVCAAHSLPVHVRVRDAILPAALVAGVATLPEYRGRGIMRAMLTEHLRRLRSLGTPLVVYRPVNFAIYRSLCHYPVADKSFIALPSSAPQPEPMPGIETRLVDAEKALDALFSVYVRATERYSACIVRSFADFALKYRDYAADGVKCAAAFRDGSIVGYSFFTGAARGIECPETLAFEHSAYPALISMVAEAAGSHDITVSLPPDVFEGEMAPPVPEGATLATVERTAAGVTDVCSLLRATRADGYAVEVLDPVLPENRGVYDISGEPTNAPPRLRLDSGRLAQLVFGYRSAAELIAQGEATPLDRTAAAELDALLPRRACYCIDEY